MVEEDGGRARGFGNGRPGGDGTATRRGFRNGWSGKEERWGSGLQERIVGVMRTPTRDNALIFHGFPKL
jgi:hypothetical protein